MILSTCVGNLLIEPVVVSENTQVDSSAMCRAPVIALMFMFTMRMDNEVWGIVVIIEHPTCSSPRECQGSRDTIKSTCMSRNEHQFLNQIQV